MIKEQTSVKEVIYKINEELSSASCFNHSILSGTLGLVYYYYNASVLLDDPFLKIKGEALLQTVFEDVNNDKGLLKGAQFSNGAAGLTSVVNYLEQNGFISFDTEEEFAEMDEYIYADALDKFASDNIDYMHGAMGAFNYFSARKQTPKINAYLNSLAGKLYEKAIATPHGTRFINLGLERFTREDVDFSLAHGLSGMLLLLMKAWPHLADQDAAEKLIRSGIDFILFHELPITFPEKEFSLYPCSFKVGSVDIRRRNRLSWCYGDLNQALLLYRAGQLFNEEKYTVLADRVGLSTVSRKEQPATMLTDTHFCHGTAGVAKFYKTLYRETGNEPYRDAAHYWITKTVTLAEEELTNKHYSVNAASLLEGWAGVALVLADSASETELGWADLLLL